MALNENIKKYRKQSGMTQKALSVKSGLSFSMISKLESGEQSNPSLETIQKIADVLRISPGELLSTAMSIEDQIDEYIEYKRGLSKSAAKYYAADQEDRCADLDFRRKLHGINNILIPPDTINKSSK